MSDIGNMKSHKFTVGQVIFFEDTGYEDGKRIAVLRDAEVTAVGRKWVSFGRHSRFAIESLKIDNGGTGWTRRVWLSRETWDNARARAKSWDQFKLLIGRIYGAPEHLSAEQIDAMSKAINGPAT